MAAGDTQITFIGHLGGDPELRFTPQGKAVARFNVGSTSRWMDRQTNEWKDGETTWLSCNVWGDMAENVCETLQRGMRVIVHGRFRQRSWEDKEGNKRTTYEIEVDEVGPSLRRATAKINKTDRSKPGRDGGGPSNDPWANAAPAGFGSGAPSGFGGGGGGFGADVNEEPPF